MFTMTSKIFHNGQLEPKTMHEAGKNERQKMNEKQKVPSIRLKLETIPFLDIPRRKHRENQQTDLKCYAPAIISNN